MRVLHLPYTYYPDPVGGTEVYVAGLTRELGRVGVESIIAAPGEAAAYTWEGVPVYRLPTEPVSGAAALYDEGDPLTALAFGRVLDAEQPDVVHLHAHTRAVSLRLVREAKRRGLPVVLTYHTPTVTCARGTLLRWGTTVCDGALDARRCTACVLQAKGMPRPVSAALAALPSAGMSRLPVRGSAATALRMRGFVEQAHAHTHSLLREVDCVVAVCAWVRDLLLHLGIAPERITLSRQGLSEHAAPTSGAPRRREGEPLRLAFLGRLDASKGLDVVLQALQRLPEAPLVLDAYVVRQGGGEGYVRKVERLVAADPRVRLLPAVPAAEVVPMLGGYDALVVPSQALESGPLVVLEALAAGTPVLGSDLGGIAELVTEGVDGLLIPASDPRAWAARIQRMLGEALLLERLRQGIRPPRTMGTAAAEMVSLYGEVCARIVPVPAEAHAPL